jgi:hypothetical protein
MPDDLIASSLLKVCLRVDGVTLDASLREKDGESGLSEAVD